MWKQRSCIFWLQEGDQNTRFFHFEALASYQKNWIDGWMDSNECWQEDMENVEDIIVD